MHFMLKCVFFLFAIQPGVVYPLLDFYVSLEGKAVEAFAALHVLVLDLGLDKWQF